MKEKLISVFGTVGFVLWWLLAATYVVVPVVATGATIWIQLVLIAVLTFTTLLGAILTPIIYVWGLIVTIQMPFGIFSVVFYVCLALWLLTEFIPSIISMFFADK